MMEGIKNNDGIKKMEGMKVYVELISGRKYTGTILSVDDSNSPIQFVNMKDKFGEIVCFPITEIKLIQEERR